jgi:hypothetical protein
MYIVVPHKTLFFLDIPVIPSLFPKLSQILLFVFSLRHNILPPLGSFELCIEFNGNSLHLITHSDRCRYFQQPPLLLPVCSSFILPRQQQLHRNKGYMSGR